MPGTFFGLEIARRGLQAHRAAMDVTAHNVANANTPGYTRQEAVMAATDPYCNPTLGTQLTPGQLGTGVLAAAVRRIRNEYLDVQVRDTLSSKEYWRVQEEIFARVEAVFPEPATDGISSLLTKFFNTWQDLNNTPQDPGVKAAVAEVGDELATMMREAYKQLEDIAGSIVKKVDSSTNEVKSGLLKDQVDAVNDILKQIRELTEAIKRVYAQGNQPNDLLDKRDMLLDRLAEYGPVSVKFTTENGKPTGEIEELKFLGVEVIADGEWGEVAVSYDPQSGTVEFTVGEKAVEQEGYAGSLKGLAAVLGKVKDYAGTLSSLSEALRDAVNGALDQEFFVKDGSLAEGTFAVHGDILSAPSTINGERALYVARLATIGMDGEEKVLGRDAQGNDITISTPDLGGATFSEYFNALLADIGARSGTASEMSKTQGAVYEQLEGLRQSVSGVNLDEELSRLIQYQYGYQASARVLAAVDEMLDYLINRML
ncbi:flagellar hook-associated protein FlgK [Desulfovirgula thermocuniculi]|uniref:flagellar hook-associated protein FlgK n=1 Tax=Desulfovirgula thermocuniculi TaxID=348842 RepID=UPI000418B591|nr:flagellar hook-associated protein FlgK [Desulfovirgula thermocuniculi]